MTRARAASVLLTTVLYAATPALGAQQTGPPQQHFPGTTTSEDARAAFQAAEFQALNAHYVRAAALARQALDADSTLGIARAYWVYVSGASITPLQRMTELDRAVDDATRASTEERLLAAAIRAELVGHAAERDALLDTLVRRLPGHPVPGTLHAFFLDDVEDRVSQLQVLVASHPSFAPVRDQLARSKFSLGDHEGAVEAVREYVRLLPDHPNAHHSAGELLQWTGNLPDALRAFQRVHELDPSFGHGDGLADAAGVHLLMGNAPAARDAFTESARLATHPLVALTRRAYAAYTHLMEGNAADGVRELTAVASDAEQRGLVPAAASWYREIALVEAAFGGAPSARVGVNLDRAAQLEGPTSAAQMRFTALAHAVAGDMARAVPASDALRAVAKRGTQMELAMASEVDAVLAAAARDFAGARDALSLAGSSASFGRAVVADALARARKRVEAGAVKEEIVNTYTLGSMDAIARARVAGL